MLPEAPVLTWLFSSWLWLLREHREREVRALVTPDTVSDASGAPSTSECFERVRALAGVQDWPLALLPDDPDAEAPEGSMAICLARAVLADPTLLVAQLATGIGQHLVQQAEVGAPDDADAVEMTGDLAAVFLGFGLFVTNRAARVLHRSEPPLLAVRRPMGALGDRELAYALAIFAWRHEIADDEVCRHLDANPRAFYRTATKDLRRRGRELSALRAVAERVYAGPYR